MIAYVWFFCLVIMLWISVLVVMDEDQGLDEGLKHTQSKESPRREETRDGKYHPLLHVHV